MTGSSPVGQKQDQVFWIETWFSVQRVCDRDGLVLGGQQRRPVNPEEAYMDTRRTCETPHRQ